jgi:hypothetical protein
MYLRGFNANVRGFFLKVIYHKKVKKTDLPTDATAEVYTSCVEIIDVKAHADMLLREINNTSWIAELNPIAKMSYEKTAYRTIARLVEIFKSVDNSISSDFGEFMISMSSGHCLQENHKHKVFPLSELWKEKVSNNHGFDFHTLSPENKLSFGESKFSSTNNSYNSSAEQVLRFAKEGKDEIDAVHLMHFCKPIAIENLRKGRKGFVVAFSINSEDHKTILNNSLENEHILELVTCCDELFIVGVKA